MKLGQIIKIKKRTLDDQNHWHEIGEKAQVKAHSSIDGKETVQIEFGGCVFGRGRATVPVAVVAMISDRYHKNR